MSRNQFDNYMPSDFFSRQTLEQTSHLLKKEHPGLSHSIQHALQQIPVVAYENLQGVYTGEMLLNLNLVEQMKAHVIGRVVSSLTDIGQKALQDHHTETSEMTNLRSLIEDWVRLTEWILQRSSADKQDCTLYQ
jgi:hypothetical protein